MKVRKTPHSENANVLPEVIARPGKVEIAAEAGHSDGIWKRRKVDTSTSSGNSTSTEVKEQMPASALKPALTNKEQSPNWPAGFRPSKIDVYTKRKFSTLMEDAFKKKRPYCFAVATNTTEKKTDKVFLDGRSFMSGWNEGPFEMPLSTYFNKCMNALSDIQLFIKRPRVPCERIGEMNEIFCHTYSMYIREMIVQEESHPAEDGHAEETAIVNLNLSIMFSAGIVVSKDQAYSDILFNGIDPIYKKSIMAEALSGVASIHDDTRFAEQLLSRKADPSLLDWSDDMSAIDAAKAQNNSRLIELFEEREIKP